MDDKVLLEYRRIRKPHAARYAGNGRVYHHKVTATQALSAARAIVDVTTRWEKAQEQGQVRLRTVPDRCSDLDDLMGDSFNPKVNSNIQPHVLERQKREYIDRVNREGLWGIVGEYRCPCCGSWKQADSVWGFVGDEWEGSFHDLDVKAATLEMV